MTSFYEDYLTKQEDKFKGVTVRYMVRSVTNPAFYMSFDNYKMIETSYCLADVFNSLDEAIEQIKRQANYEGDTIDAEIVSIISVEEDIDD